MQQPKTDWRPNDLKNYGDHNRQVDNITHGAKEILPPLGYNPPVGDMPLAQLGMPYLLSMVNAVENSLAAIEACGIPLPEGWEQSKEWLADLSAPNPDYRDWNRWERNIALLAEMADRMHRTVDLGWVLGMAHIGLYGGL